MPPSSALASYALSLFLPLVVAAAGVALAWVGWRGRRVGEHPECRRCGFDLFGRPEGSTVCPECGAELAKKGAVLAAGVVRRPGFLAAGLVLAAGGLLRLAGGAWDEISRDPDDWKPSAWLAREAFGGDATRRTAAVRQLNYRLERGKLSDARIAALTERALSRQADANTPWDPTWGDWIEAARLASKLPDEQWARYLRQAAEQVAEGAKMRVRPRIRRGDPIPLVVTRSPARVGNRSAYAVTWDLVPAFDGEESGPRVSASFDQLAASGARPMPVTLVAPDAAGPGRRFEPIRSLPVPDMSLKDGRHTLALRGTVRVFRTRSTGGLPEVEMALRLEAAWELLPEGSPPFEVETDPARLEAMEKVLAGTSARLVALAHPSLYHAEARRDPNLLRWAEAHSSVVFEGMQWPEALPTGLSHDVFLRSGDREWPAGSISAAPGATAARVGRPQYIGDLRAERVDVVLRPNASQAPETLDVLRVWPHEFVVRDVPVAPDPRGLPVRAGK